MGWEGDAGGEFLFCQLLGMQLCMVLLFLSCEEEVLTHLFRDVIRIIKEFLFMCGYMSVYTCTEHIHVHVEAGGCVFSVCLRRP